MGGSKVNIVQNVFNLVLLLNAHHGMFVVERIW